MTASPDKAAGLRIHEIFISIQGESSHAGLPCVFIRLTGCPLRCTWCDTAYAYDEGMEMTIGELTGRLEGFAIPLVSVTGGEPLAQPETFELIKALCDSDYTVLLETNGAMDIAAVDPRAVVIMDVKCPGSGMTDRMRWSNLELLKPADEVKFVIGSRSDYEFARGIMEKHQLAKRCSILLSTVYGKISSQRVVRWMLKDRLRARFQLQLHKYIWPPNQRGV